MKRLDVEIVTPPVELLIDFNELKQAVRVFQDLEDGLITTFVRAAIQSFQKTSWQVLQSTSFKGFTTDWDDSFNINQFPVTSITSVKYYDTANVLQTAVLDTDYFVNLKSDPALIEIEETPSLFDKPNNIEVEFTAGYATLFDIDPDIIVDIYALSGTFYEQRQADSSRQVFKVPYGFEFLSGNNNKRSF